MPKLSLVIPMFNEEKIIENSIKRVESILTTAGIEYELILIDDGSRDDTWKVIKELSQQHPHLRAAKLSRNFGKESAIFAGLDLVKGDCCICIDADMQHPPELIPKMYKLWKEEAIDVVEAYKSDRGQESLFYKYSAKLFYRLLHKLSGINLENASDFRLLDKRALETLRAMPEKQTFFRGLSTWIGFTRKQIAFDVEDRSGGSTKWSLSSLIKLAIHAISSFTAAPLYLSAFLGFGLLVAFVILLIQTFIMKFLGHASDGFTTVIGLQLVIGATLLSSIGTIGIYIEKIYEEVKNRPRYIVQELINEQDDS